MFSLSNVLDTQDFSVSAWVVASLALAEQTGNKNESRGSPNGPRTSGKSPYSQVWCLVLSGKVRKMVGRWKRALVREKVFKL